MMRMRLLAFALLLAGAYAAEMCDCPGNSALAWVSQSSSKFARDFSKNVLDNAGENNVVFSSLGVYLFFSMIYYGVDDINSTTANELRNAMLYPPHCCQDSVRDYLNRLQGQEKVRLDIGTKVYVTKNHTVKKNFKTFVEKVLNSSVDTIDNPQTVVTKVNKWVSEKTNKKITNLLNSDDVDKDTELILLNFVYFNAKWASPFKFIIPGNFYNLKNELVATTMMSQTNDFYYAENSKLNGSLRISLPYENPYFRMIIIIPKDINHFHDVGKQLGNFAYQDLLKDMKKSRIELIMPKFKVETTLELQPVLEKMNVKNLFRNVDFIFKNKFDAKLEKVRQKAIITVDENGTEAGAATSRLIVSKFGSDEPKIVIDKPFYYILYGALGPLFQGQITSSIAP